MRTFVVVKKITVSKASAITSAISIGFPSVTAFAGFTHALERKVGKQHNLNFGGVAIASHEFNLRVLKEDKFSPLKVINHRPPHKKPEGQVSKPSAEIPTPVCDMVTSVCFEVHGEIANESEFTNDIKCNVDSMRLAGGNIIHVDDVTLVKLGKEDEDFELMKHFYGSYILIERTDLVKVDVKDFSRDALDSVLNKCMVHKITDESGTVYSREVGGYIVPISVGFQAVSEAVVRESQRDATTPSRMAESIATLGEFIPPYRAKLSSIFWNYAADEKRGIYTCTQNK